MQKIRISIKLNKFYLQYFALKTNKRIKLKFEMLIKISSYKIRNQVDTVNR